MRKALALFFAWVVGLVSAYYVVNKVRVLLLMLLVAVFLALAMEPLVNKLVRRGWRRGLATGLLSAWFLLATIGFFAAFGSSRSHRRPSWSTTRRTMSAASSTS